MKRVLFDFDYGKNTKIVKSQNDYWIVDDTHKLYKYQMGFAMCICCILNTTVT